LFGDKLKINLKKETAVENIFFRKTH
jgi:hypothetical protein